MRSMTPAGGSLLKDRTSDFQAMTQRLMRQLHIAGGPHQHPCPVHQQSEFTRQALQIGGSISKTSTQLQRLVQLSKQTTMFHDPATEIESLTGIIKQDIQALNMQLTQLQHLCDTANNHQQQEHTSTVVDQLRSRLKSTTQDFKDVLTTRTENLKACDERRRLFCNQAEEAEFLHTAPLLHHTGTGSRIAGANRCNNSSEMQPPPHQQQQQQQPLLPGYNSRGGSSKPSAAELFGGSSGVRRRRHDEEHSHGPPRNHNMGSSSSSNSSSAEAAAAAAAGGVWQQQQQQQYMPHSQTATSSRVAALSNVEATIVELGSIFTQLADLVAAQGDMTQRIDENIGETLANVDSAKQQLMKYLNSISSNRWLMLKVFSVLVVFLVVFILFVA